MDAKKLIGAIESAGYEARSYSGRGMFGKECVGVEIPQDDTAFALAAKLILAVFASVVKRGAGFAIAAEHLYTFLTLSLAGRRASSGALR